MVCRCNIIIGRIRKAYLASKILSLGRLFVELAWNVIFILEYYFSVAKAIWKSNFGKIRLFPSSIAYSLLISLQTRTMSVSESK